MIDISIAVPLGVLLLTILLSYLFRGRRNLPPGPIRLPIIGNIHQIIWDIQVNVTNLSKTYGPVMLIHLGSIPMVVVSDASVARQVFATRGATFADRSNFEILSRASRQNQSILHGDYTEAWKIHRKIAHKALHLFGQGMKSMEEKILLQLTKFCSTLERSGGQPISVDEPTDYAILNVICHAVFGKEYEKYDPEFIELKHNFHSFIKIGKLLFTYESMPLVRWISSLFSTSLIGILPKTIKKRDEIFEEKFRLERDAFQEGKVTNYVEALLQASVEEEKEDAQCSRYMNHDRMVMSMFEVFIAGFETTSTSVQWAVLYLTVWPEAQEKLYNELERVVGKPNSSLAVHLEHQRKLPMVVATVMESLRLGSVAFIPILRRVHNDTKLCGFDIPKGTLLAINQWGIHHNEKHWKDPFEFKPERFLDCTGELKRDVNPAYMPFSAGERRCIGESLAKPTLFLFIANLVHQFKLSVDPDVPHPDLKGICNFTLSPSPYKIVATKRSC